MAGVASEDNDVAADWENLEWTGSTSPTDETEDVSVEDVYRQFVVDVPRMDIVIGDKPWKDHPTLLFMDLWQRLLARDPSKKRAARVLRLCSQSELVSWFVMGQKRWIEGREQESHFLDGGRQRTEIHLADKPPHTVQSITISKPFRVVDFAANAALAPQERFRVCLTLTHNLDTDTTTYAWTRKEGQSADWIFVEACAEQPLLPSSQQP